MSIFAKENSSHPAHVFLNESFYVKLLKNMVFVRWELKNVSEYYRKIIVYFL